MRTSAVLLALLMAVVASAVHAHDLAVVIVDMQPEYLFPQEGGRGFQVQSAIRKQQVLLQWAHHRDIPVLVFEVEGFSPTVQPLARILSRLRRKVVVQKKFSSGFQKTGAEHLLRMWGAHRLVIAGVNAGVCVKETGEDAMDLGFEVVTSADLLEDLNPWENYPASNFGDILAQLRFVKYPSLRKMLRCAEFLRRA